MKTTVSFQEQLLGLGFLGLLLAILIGGFGLWGIMRVVDSMNRMGVSAAAMRSHLTADQMRDALRADVLAAMIAAEGSSSEKKNEVLKDLSEHAALFREQLKKIEVLPLQGEIKEAIQRMRPDLDAYADSGEGLARMILEGRLEAVARLDGFVTAYKKMKGEMQDLSDLIENDVKLSQEKADRTTQISRVTIILISLIGFSVLSAFSLRTAASASVALKQVSVMATEVVAGNLTIQNEITRKDEIGRLSEALNRMTEHLRKMVYQIQEKGAQIASTSKELSLSSQRMSANSEETERLVSTVSAASEQTSRNVQTVATAAEEMTATLKEISANVLKATQITSQAVDVAQGTNQTISKLGESSAQIGEVVKVITAIAQQTNLLALNAAIEAARAGEAGKGFAVVANEVKDLAKKTAQATEQIGQKIGVIQTDTKEAVSAIGEISGIIREINEIATTIAGALEEQTATTQEISRSVQEAARGTGDVSRNIAEVVSAAKRTAEAAASLLTISQSLGKMGTQLMTATEKIASEAGSIQGPGGSLLIEKRSLATSH